MNKVSHMRTYRDAANAVPSISHTAILYGTDFIVEPWVRDLLCDHVQKNIFTISNNDNDISVRGDSDCFAGSSAGGHLFNCGFLPSFRKRCAERQRRSVASHLNATCPLAEGEINIVTTGFADGCGTVVTGASLETLTHLARIDDDISDSALGDINRKQNTDSIVKHL